MANYGYLLLRKESNDNAGYFSSKLCTDIEIINYINMLDIYSDFEDYAVYAIMGLDKVERLTYVGWQPGCLIQLKDSKGNVVISGYGEDH